MPVPIARDPGATRAQLTKWLAETFATSDGDRVVECVELTRLEFGGENGYSNETIVFDATWRRGGRVDTGEFVARVKPTGYSIFPEYDLLLQARVMDILSRETDSPVPRVVGATTEEESPLGQPFFVMERIRGDVPADHPPYPAKGWLVDASPADQALVFDRGLQEIAKLHRLDWRGLGLGFLDRTQYGPAGIVQHNAMTGPLYEWVADGRTIRLLEDSWAWLQANAPDDPRVVLNWGDARLGNMMFRDYRPVAILDWEMVTVGPGDLDLAWWLVFHHYYTYGRGFPNLPGFPDDEEAVARYEELVGAPVQHFDYYLKLQAFRAVLPLLRLRDMMVERGVLDPASDRAPDLGGYVVLERMMER
jgi:aminoglycoside phosphotransferase (APT) family kinase protein